MNLADRLRELAERLPPGTSVLLTRNGLLELAVDDGGRAAMKIPRPTSRWPSWRFGSTGRRQQSANGVSTAASKGPTSSIAAIGASRWQHLRPSWLGSAVSAQVLSLVHGGLCAESSCDGRE